MKDPPPPAPPHLLLTLLTLLQPALTRLDVAASGPEQQVDRLLESKFPGNHMSLATWGGGGGVI